MFEKTKEIRNIYKKFSKINTIVWCDKYVNERTKLCLNIEMLKTIFFKRNLISYIYTLKQAETKKN